MENKNKKYPNLKWEDEPMETKVLNGKLFKLKQKSLIGYIVFVSYNRDQYELNDIAIDDMTLKEFIKFYQKDFFVNCKSVHIHKITENTKVICGGSEIADDSVYYYVSADIAHTDDTIKNFINSLIVD